MKVKKDLSNLIFGKLKVLRIGDVVKKRQTWVCQCECGTIKNISASNLLNKKRGTKSCGCIHRNSKKYNFQDLTNHKYGQLLVVSKSNNYTKTRGVLWNCLCDCGNIVKVPSNGLTSGNNITCGDKNKHAKSIGFCGEIPLSHINAIKQNAIKRNLKYDLDNNYLWELFIGQNRLCALSGILLTFTKENNSHKFRSTQTTASLDRIDNSSGYIKGNVRWVHKDINKMRSNHNDDIFLEYCKLCYLNRYNNLPRPSFNEYFMMLAFDVSLRSDDPNIKHGAIIVDGDNHIVGTGYNGTIKNADKKYIPYDIRDEKRKWMIHAEENAMLNCVAYGNRKNLRLFVTGLPCVNCLQRIINFGITNIIYAKRIGSITEDEKTEEMRQKIIKMSGIEMTIMNIDNIWIQKVII